MSNPVERIKRFIDARTGVRGLDPNIVHSINTNGEQENLTLPDLRALLADLERAEMALREVDDDLALEGFDKDGAYREPVRAALAQMAGG